MFKPFTIYWYRTVHGQTVLSGPSDRTPEQLREDFANSATPLLRAERIEREDQLPLLADTIQNWSQQSAMKSSGGQFSLRLLRERLAEAKVGM